MKMTEWAALVVPVLALSGCEGKKEISCESICSHYAACQNGAQCEDTCPAIRERVRDGYWDKVADCILDLECNSDVDELCHEPLLEELTVTPCLVTYAHRDCELLFQCGQSAFNSEGECWEDRELAFRHVDCPALEATMANCFDLPCVTPQDSMAIFNCIHDNLEGIYYVVWPYLGERQIMDAYDSPDI
jgi:hypothetical protein